jgi:hypothetical protein
MKLLKGAIVQCRGNSGISTVSKLLTQLKRLDRSLSILGGVMILALKVSFYKITLMTRTKAMILSEV